MHEVASSPVYEQDTVASSVEDAERALPATSVSGQVSAQWPWRVLTVNAEAEESSEENDYGNGEEHDDEGREDRVPGQVRDCYVSVVEWWGRR